MNEPFSRILYSTFFSFSVVFFVVFRPRGWSWVNVKCTSKAIGKNYCREWAGGKKNDFAIDRKIAWIAFWMASGTYSRWNGRYYGLASSLDPVRLRIKKNVSFVKLLGFFKQEIFPIWNSCINFNVCCSSFYPFPSSRKKAFSVGGLNVCTHADMKWKLINYCCEAFWCNNFREPENFPINLRTALTPFSLTGKWMCKTTIQKGRNEIKNENK